MKIETAIERLQEMIGFWEFLMSIENDDKYTTSLELEALRMAVRALESKPRWIPCSERLPILHKEEFGGEMFYTSDTVMFSTADRVHVGFCVQYGKELIWEIQDGLACKNVTAWMPMPEVYSKE